MVNARTCGAVLVTGFNGTKGGAYGVGRLGEAGGRIAIAFVHGGTVKWLCKFLE